MIPVNEPLLNGREKELLIECIDTGWISSDGPFVKDFEKKFGNFLALPPGVAVCNGTAALETALFGLGVNEGDEVIMPSFTIISCALAVLRIGAVPVLVDITPDTWCMDVSKVEERISPRTKVILPVHIYGHPVDMDPIIRLAKKYNLKILEDAAEVHGAEYYSKELGGQWIKCGAIGHASIFSFYANKIITTGEGGMVLSPDSEVLNRARYYRNLCFRSERRFFHTELGYNFRMTNLQAAIGIAQLERIEEFINIKRLLGAYYSKKLAKIPGIRFQVEKPWARTVYWMYAIELDPILGLDSETLIKQLSKHEIGTRPFFLGLHAQPALQNLSLFVGESYPNTDRASTYGLYLPSGMNLIEEQIDTVCECLKNIIKEKTKI